MRIRVLSDLHLEFWPWEPPDAPADVVVFAGDIHIKDRALAWMRGAVRQGPIVYVPGNHEYYREAIPKHTHRLREQGAALGIHVLEQGSVVIGGVRFLGCTLWTDLALFGDAFDGIAAVADRMTDFRSIRVSPEFRRLTPGDWRAWHRQSLAWLRNELSSSDVPTVVVTHHAPSARSLGEEVATDPVSAAYASNLERILETMGPALWIHGHIHNSSDYRIGPTRVVCNPRGYPDEPCPTFDPMFCVDIEG